MHPADPLVALLRPQFVRPLVLSLKRPGDPLATWLCPQDVCLLVLSLECTLLISVAPPLVCMSPFTETHSVDPLATLVCPQNVHHLVLSLKCTLLTLLWPRSPLRMYVISS